jgi:zinc protease
VTDSNGSTDFDRTNYYDTVPANQIELALWTHSDRMGYLLDVLDQTALSNQQDVVRNERRQNIENRPYGIVEEALYHQLFPKTHPYHGNVMGSHADIQAAKLDDIRRFFETYYRPNNASLVIVGDIDKSKTRMLVTKYFGSFRRGPDVPKLTVVTPPITSERRAVIEDRVELPRVFMGWLTTPIYQAGDAELDVVAQVLGGGKSSRLYKSLVYQKQIAQDVSVSQNSNALTSVFVIDVTARAGHSAQEIEAAIDTELQALRNDGPTDQELERARNTIETGMLLQIEKVGGSGMANQLNQYNQYLGDPAYLAQDLERHRKVSSADVQRVMTAQLQSNNRGIVYGVPGTQDLGPEVATPPAPMKIAGAKASSLRVLNKEEHWRQQVPKAGPVKLVTLPRGDAFKLANGLTVIHHYNPTLPMVAAELVIKSGSEANPLGRSGLASFTAQMLEQGTRTRSALQIADEVAQLGAFLGAGSSADVSSVEVMSIRSNFSQALALLADVAQNPVFPAEEVERQRSSLLGELSQQRDSAEALASRAALAALYGDQHPYGFSTLGTESSITSIQRAELMTFWQQHYVPNNAALIVSGDITRVELTALAQTSFGNWRSAKVDNLTPSVVRTTQARLVLIDKPGSSQTALRVTGIGPDRKTPLFEALEVMNAALGGLFTSRLNTILREQKGYTYAVGSGFAYRRLPGPFAIATSVRTEVTAAALDDIFRQLGDMRAKPMSAIELDKTRKSLMFSLPGQFETNKSISASLANIFVYDLALDYFSGLAARYSGVTARQVQTVSQKYLQSDQLIVVGVGDKQKIEPLLSRLKIGPVEYRDVDVRVLK